MQIARYTDTSRDDSFDADDTSDTDRQLNTRDDTGVCSVDGHCEL